MPARAGDALDRLDELEVHRPDRRDHSESRARSHRGRRSGRSRASPAPRSRAPCLAPAGTASAAHRAPRCSCFRCDRPPERRQSAARMSFVEVLPVDPVIPTTSASLRDLTALPRAAMAHAVARDEGGRAAPTGLIHIGDAANGDEQISRPHAARVDLDAGDLVRVGLEPAQRPDLLDRERITRAPSGVEAPHARPRGRRRNLLPGDILVLLGAAAGDHDDVLLPRLGGSLGDRLARSGSTSAGPTTPVRISSMIASGSSLRGCPT